MLIQAICDSIMGQKVSEKSTFTPKDVSLFLQGKLASSQKVREIIFFGNSARNRKVEIKVEAEELLLFIYIGDELINKYAPEKMRVQELEEDSNFSSFIKKVQEKMEHAVCQAIFTGGLSEEDFYKTPPEEVPTKTDIEKLQKKLKIKEALESQRTFAKSFTVKRLTSTLDAILSSSKTYMHYTEWGEICIEGNSLSPKKVTLFADSKRQCFQLRFVFGDRVCPFCEEESLLNTTEIQQIRDAEESERMELLFSMAREKLEDDILLSIFNGATRPEEVLGEWHKFDYATKKPANKKLLKEVQELAAEVLADFSPKNFSDKTDENMEKLFKTILKLSDNVERNFSDRMSWRRY